MASQVLAQSPYVLHYFDLDELGSVPGEVLVSDDYQTLIEFEGMDLDGEPTSARIDLLTVDTSEPGVVKVRANREMVNTDLVIPVGGTSAMFTLTFDSRAASTRRYVVRDSPPPESITSLREGREGRTRRQLPTPSAPLPDGVVFDASILYMRDGEMVVQYALGNTGENPIANDPGRLELVQGEGKVPYTLSRVAPRGSLNRIFPGEAEYGTVVVTEPPSGKITLRWPLVEIGPGRTYVLTKELNEGLTREVPR